MAGMYPTMVSDPNDPNRRFRGTVTNQWPRSLTIAFYLICIAAVIMLATSFILLLNGIPSGAADAEARARFRTNLLVTAWGNIILAVLLSCFASYFRKGNRTARRGAAACVALACFLNVAGFVVQVIGWASISVVALLAFAMLFAFRPDANAFVEKMSPRY